MNTHGTDTARMNDASVRSFLERYYEAMETNNPSAYGAYYSENIRLTFGNEPTINGRGAVIDAFDSMLSQFESLHHDLVSVRPQEAGLVVFESLGTWRLLGGETVTIPACSLFRIENGLLVDLRIYVDNAPVFEALERERAA